MATVEERLALLEARLGVGVEPRALTPPITIGEMTNVPAPGSQLAAQWAQDASSRVVQRFPTTAGLKAYGAPVGSFAIALDTGVLWRRAPAGWAQQTPWSANLQGIATDVPGITTLVTVNVPADPGARLTHASCFLRIDRFGPAPANNVYLVRDGVAQVQTDFLPQIDTSGAAGTNIPVYASMVASWPTNPAGETVTMQLGANSNGTLTGGWKIYANYLYNRLDVVVMPKG